MFDKDKLENLIINNESNFCLEMPSNNTLSFETLDNLIKENDLKEIESLEEMGFPKKMIKKVYAFLNPINISETVKFLSKVNGIYQHEFHYYYNKKSDKCLICNEDKEHHYKIKENNNNKYKKEDEFIDSFVSLDTEVINSSINSTNNYEGNELCKLCEEQLTNEEIEKNTLLCKHNFCISCWIEYLKEKLSSSRIQNIKCIENKSKIILSDSFIKSIIENDNLLLNKYEEYKLKENILNNPNMKFCPYPDCDSYAKRENKNEKNVTCYKNKHKFCFKCLKPCMIINHVLMK